MIEPWLSAEASKIIPMLITVLPLFILGVTSGFVEGETFGRYLTIMLALALTGNIGAIIFGLVAKFLGQPSSVFFSFLLGGVISTVIVIGFWYIKQQISK